ncbi:MAG TPA: carboxypeptidase-like regulatory domain-containing protein [Candidatus Acidoferrum sp.]|nr:carboxypeptidase-like regulatory domain-containing protein [Candidatus Acidoferrum sp.]
MMMREVYKIFGAMSLLAALLFGARAYGQGGATGAIGGAVVDTSGASIGGAEVQIVNASTESIVRKLSTNADGDFVATLLPPGTYYVVVNKSGFGEAKAEGIEVRVTETTRVTVTLKPGTVSERVEISAHVSSVETTNAATGESIGTSTIRELPLATQNYQQLLTLSSGAQSELNASAQLGRGNVRVIVNGQREDNNNYLIEGISATDYNVAQATNVPLPNPDVIQEFKVQTSLYDASQGRNGGGNVNAILKSGTKEFHGDAYEFFRNDVLNANEFFLNAAGQKRPSVKQNIFGGSLGGPVVKEKFGYFFVNYQGTRQRSALSPGTQVNNPAFPSLPTDRSAASIAAALSTASFPISAANIDPVALALLQFKSNQFGDPNGFLIPSVGTPNLNPAKAAYATAPFIATKPGKYTDDQFTTNWDREFGGGRDKVSVRFFFSDAESLLPFGAGGLQASLGGTLSSSISATDLNFPYDLPVAARFFTVNETHLFSPALVNDFRFGYVRINNSLLNIPPVTATDLGIQRPTNNITTSIYKFTLGSSGFQIGPTPPADQFQTQNNYNFVDTVSWVKGAHVWRFGGEFTRVNLDKLFPQVFNGQLFFVNATGGATDFQKLLVGAPDFSFGGGGVFNHEYRTNDFSVYGQDDWKARRNLTLNLGLRVEVLGGFHDNKCHIGNLDQDLANSGKYPFIYGDCVKGLNLTGLSATGSDTTYKNNYTTALAPRVGFAYDIGGHQTTTIRGGFGIYFAREDVGTVDQLSFQAPFLPVAFSGGPPGSLSNFFLTPPNTLPQGGVLDPNFVPCLGTFAGFVLNGTSTPTNDTTQTANYACAAGSPGVVPSQFLFGLTVPRHFVAPSTQQWNLTMQRALGRQWVLEVGYVGTHAVHLRETRTSIQARLASPSNPIVLTDTSGKQFTITTNTTSNGPARSNNSGINGYNGFQLFADDAYSHYHSLQVTLSRRSAVGYFQGAYTFSKSTDATSSGNTALNTAFNDESTLDGSRGLSDFDRPHRLTVSYRYELPFFSKTDGWKHAALADWAISGITIFQSGTPFSVTDSAAGSAFLGPGLTPGTLGAQLASGGSLSAGLTSGSVHDRVNNGYLNLANFTAAPLVPASQGGDGTVTFFGNLGRNIYRGPFQQNWDFSLIKNFNITERQQLRFTTDFFNIWNHANFANPAINDVENPGAFGKIFSTVGTPRLIQFALRYAF